MASDLRPARQHRGLLARDGSHRSEHRLRGHRRGLLKRRRRARAGRLQERGRRRIVAATRGDHRAPRLPVRVPVRQQDRGEPHRPAPHLRGDAVGCLDPPQRGRTREPGGRFVPVGTQTRQPVLPIRPCQQPGLVGGRDGSAGPPRPHERERRHGRRRVRARRLRLVHRRRALRQPGWWRFVVPHHRRDRVGRGPVQDRHPRPGAYVDRVQPALDDGRRGPGLRHDGQEPELPAQRPRQPRPGHHRGERDPVRRCL